MSKLIDAQPSVSEKPKKVDAEKVLQGLRCCDCDDPVCEDCPYHVDTFHCYSYLRQDAITVIEQLRKEVMYIGKA